MMGWWRRPAPRSLKPEPAQLADAITLWRAALTIADGNDQRAWLIAFRLLKARRIAKEGRS